MVRKFEATLNVFIPYIAQFEASFPEAFDSSVGRAVDCSGLWTSIGRWFESGSKDFFFIII